MKKTTHIILLLLSVLVLSSCATCRHGAVYTKNARWVGGNAKRFQHRHDLKMKADSVTSKNLHNEKS